MRTRHLISVAMIPLLTVGCASTPPVRARMTPDQARAELGTITVVSVDQGPIATFDRPMTSRAQAAKAMGLAAAAIGLAPAAAGHPIFVLAGLALAPVAGAGGAIYGALAARSPEDVAAAVRTLETSIDDSAIQRKLRDLVVSRLTGAGYSAVVSDEAGVEAASSDGRTLVEVQVSTAQLIGTGLNPPLELKLTGLVRAPGALQGGLILEAPGGKTRTLLSWAADDAKRFRAEVTRTLEVLADRMIGELLFPRPSPA